VSLERIKQCTLTDLGVPEQNSFNLLHANVN
jgi:hypothetical protein